MKGEAKVLCGRLPVRVVVTMVVIGVLVWSESSSGEVVEMMVDSSSSDADAHQRLYKLGSPVEMKKDVQLGNIRSGLSTLPFDLSAKFGTKSIVVLPTIFSKAQREYESEEATSGLELEGKEELKLRLSFDNDRFVTHWYTVPWMVDLNEISYMYINVHITYTGQTIQKVTTKLLKADGSVLKGLHGKEEGLFAPKWAYMPELFHRLQTEIPIVFVWTENAKAGTGSGMDLLFISMTLAAYLCCGLVFLQQSNASHFSNIRQPRGNLSDK
eukprot:Nk52_evm54s217 gene=Nk52_evmTU54s217